MTRREKLCRVAVLLGIAVFGLLWFTKPQYSADPLRQTLTEATVYRLLGAVIFLMLSFYLGMRLWNRPARGTCFVLLPALAVVVNNFPFWGLLSGQAQVVHTDLLPLFLVDCLFIGMFEELAFRGVLFLAILEKRRSTRRQIFWTTVISSELFGLVHLANLLEGGGPAVILQVGYSFLIGGMCAIVLLKSGNLIFSILLHTVFDIGGRLIDTLGEGRIWNLPTVVVTAVLGVAVAAWLLYALLHIDPQTTDRFYPQAQPKTE